jgi:hypothetical protein
VSRKCPTTYPTIYTTNVTEIEKQCNNTYPPNFYRIPAKITEPGNALLEVTAWIMKFESWN